jgi:nitroreductase
MRPFSVESVSVNLNRLSPPPGELPAVRRAVEWAITTRRSVRAFLPEPVAVDVVEAILNTARFAASGVNMQPWKVHVLMGAAKDRVCAAIRTVDDDPALAADHGDEWPYYPLEWTSPYLDRLFFTVDRVMNEGTLLDYGMFLQNIMVVARTYGLSTCPQAAFMKYHRIIEQELALGAEEKFVVGMSLGYADEERIENSLASEREPASSFTTFHKE